MTIVKQSMEVNYTCAEMYALVNDVDNYVDFFPYCLESTVHYRAEDEVRATLVMGMSGVHKSFETHNFMQLDKMIEMRLIGGPFSRFEGYWRFDPIASDGCKISFDLEFELSSPLFSMMLNSMLTPLTDQLLSAFCKRADELYARDLSKC